MFGHDEIIVGAERNRPVHVVRRAVVLPGEEIGNGKPQVRLGIPIIEQQCLLAGLEHLGQAVLRHFPEPVVHAGKAQEPVRTGAGRIGLDRRVAMLPSPAIVGPRVALQTLLSPQDMLVGLKAARCLRGDCVVGECRQPPGDSRGHGSGNFDLDVEQVLGPVVVALSPRIPARLALDEVQREA